MVETVSSGVEIKTLRMVTLWSLLINKGKRMLDCEQPERSAPGRPCKNGWRTYEEMAVRGLYDDDGWTETFRGMP